MPLIEPNTGAPSEFDLGLMMAKIAADPASFKANLDALQKAKADVATAQAAADATLADAAKRLAAAVDAENRTVTNLISIDGEKKKLADAQYDFASKMAEGQNHIDLNNAAIQVRETAVSARENAVTTRESDVQAREDAIQAREDKADAIMAKAQTILNSMNAAIKAA